MATLTHRASNMSKISTDWTKVGASTRITSPGSMNAWQTRFMASSPPERISTFSTSQETPLGASSSRTTTSRRSRTPSMGPYCRASTPRPSVRRTSSASWRIVSTGRVSLAGEPPPKEMMFGSVMDPNSPFTTLAVKAMYSMRLA